MEENKLRAALQEKEIVFEQHFYLYQKNVRRFENYIKYDAFKDLKLIFEIYSEIFHLRGYNYNKLTPDKMEKLLTPFSISEQRELLNHLIKSLSKNGNDDEAKEMMCILNDVELKYYWEKIKNGQDFFTSLFKLFLKGISYNLYILLLMIIIYLFFSTLIFCDAKFEIFAIIEVKKISFTECVWSNNFANLISYLFELDEKMEVKPLNFWGVILLAFQKAFLFLVIGNYLIMEMFNKIKLQ
ncbi:hypothetical protein DI487_04895 [Flavobacterium sediminis]|uniref:Uncharacterized protein n=1 Tax=Flavobacterium sediminis TaxID=2201181 RepID=A0A2U8QTX6_9FLAO|nr:hypothetical protein [Flavobacterium sediminis]AWM13265.1 hypothetical protein DI487_04895 [Flavobacterium sediminis]